MVCRLRKRRATRSAAEAVQVAVRPRLSHTPELLAILHVGQQPRVPSGPKHEDEVNLGFTLRPSVHPEAGGACVAALNSMCTRAR